MPPKKKDAAENKPIIMGRMGTNLKCGIVGLPNVGKSTFFNVLTKSTVAASNFSFCTIEPNESRVAVPDERWNFLCDYHKPMSKVPAFLNIMDIAGLVKGASEGEGLGNAFLSHISQVDAIMHMCRLFDGEDIEHVEGDVNPVRDIEIIHNELRLKDVELVKKQVEGARKDAARGGADKNKQFAYDTLCKVLDLVEEQEKHVRFGNWDLKETEEINKHLFLTAKPMIYLLNLSKKDYVRKKEQMADESERMG